MDDLALLYKVKLNQVRMIRDRGYDIEDEANLLTYSFDNFKEVYSAFIRDNGMTIRQALGGFYSYPPEYQGENTGPIWVAYLEIPEGSHVGKEQIIPIIETAIDPSYSMVKKILLITSVELSPLARTALGELSTHRIEVFHTIDLSYVPIDNYLVPKHVLMTPADKEKTFKGKDISKIPLISVEDPIARYYGAVPGQVFRIYRRDLTGTSLVTESIFYRLVVDRPIKEGR
jgi:DNA-directed RNA polymerase subunit H (RpoH/RPB5)